MEPALAAVDRDLDRDHDVLADVPALMGVLDAAEIVAKLLRDEEDLPDFPLAEHRVGAAIEDGWVRINSIGYRWPIGGDSAKDCFNRCSAF